MVDNTGDRSPWPALWALCVGFFMILVDTTIVSVETPTILADLRTDVDAVVWVTSAYLLAYAVPLLITGRLGDRFGPRRVYLVGLTVFTLASLWCGFTSTIGGLIAARVVQGLGAAVMMPQTMAVITRTFPAESRGRAMSLWGAVAGVATLVGPILGGVLVDGLGWEWIFFVNVPIGIAAIFITETKLVNVRATDPQPIDWPGLVTFSAALFLLIFGLIRGNAEGWGSPVIVACLAAAAALLVAFVLIEIHRRNAMLDMSLFRNPSFAGVSIVAFCLSAGMFSIFLFLTLYMQDVLGYSPLETGLRFLPLTLLSFIVAPISARLSNRVPFRVLMGVGLLLVGVGLILMNGIDAGDGWTTLLLGFLIGGAGIGMTNPGIASVAIGVVEPARAGMASGINSTFRQVGIATGVAALGAIFQARVDTKLAESLPQAPAAFSDAVSAGAVESALPSIPPQFRDQAVEAANAAFIGGLNEILLIGAGIAIAGSIASWLLIRSRDMVGHPAPPEAEAAPEGSGEPVPAR